MELIEFREKYHQIVDEISQVVLGQREVINHTIVALIASGHILLEGVPGLGKTLLVRALSTAIGSNFGRVQFTPDLMPSDITGGEIFNAQTNAFEFVAGPIFHQLVLADEINRAPAKTQSALLEAMQERAITISGNTYPLPAPFLVLATQNPIESQGTYPLPEAELDRFLVKIRLNYPDPSSEQELLANYARGFNPQKLELKQVVTFDELQQMQEVLKSVAVSDPLMEYIVRIVNATRQHRNLEMGASPRASIGLLQTGRAHAASQARSFLTPDDVKSFAPAVLRHRVILHPDSELEGITADDVIASILAETSVPGGVS